MKDEELKHS